MKKVFNIKLLLITLTGILISGVSVSAAIKLSSLEVNYDNKESKLTSNDVQKAIDELNVKINEKILEAEKDCPEGQVCTRNWNFDYTGGEQVFTISETGTYKLETWGSQGGEILNFEFQNYGGYSIGVVYLNKNDKLYINVGGKGLDTSSDEKGFELEGGYNGGGKTLEQWSGGVYSGSGGGATHIATKSGLLSSLENFESDILIVSGGGGGSGRYSISYRNFSGGAGGGFVGNSGEYSVDNTGFYGLGGTQTDGGSYHESYNNIVRAEPFEGAFGIGGTSSITGTYAGGRAGGGGGYYGGAGSTSYHGAGGGSGYIGNTLLTNKSMYCYNCQESTEESTKTISTTNVSETPTAGYAKQGNGYARITYYLE